MNRTKQVLLHTCIWIALLVFFMLLGSNSKISYRTVVVVIYFGVVNIGIFYINYLFILPRFLNQKRYTDCAIWIMILIFGVAIFKFGIALVFKDLVLARGIQKGVYLSFLDYFLGAVIINCFFVFLSTGFRFMVDWFTNEKIHTALQNEKLTAELAFLKSQINPHFLFNSLNNIYSLAYQKSDQTPEAILKLSEIMRYMLYESNDNKVGLDKEIRYLENYIELQKLRFKNSASVVLSVEGDPHNKYIMPLILISFVENAFKHGIATDPENPIRIAIKIDPGKLYFSTHNLKNNHNKDQTVGIGLANVKRRLDLFYKNQYRLEIENGSSLFSCDLYLDL
ncbi:MAG: hypothetical protein JWQ25_1811 [Daejeonella sp.]|nr:hypothetical protein [Daejeonella sp.]